MGLAGRSHRPADRYRRLSWWRWLAAFGLLITLASAGGAVAATPAAGKAASGLFGSIEIRSTRLAAFGKWTGMLARFEAERARASSCQPTRFSRCFLRDWDRFIADLKNRDPRSQVEAVHARMNLSPYITDPRNWGVRDYWATPVEFLRKDGDCEDYAIAKYMALRALGFDADQLRIVVLQDLNLNVPHAVLAVYLNGRTLILDNQISRVVDAATIRHYRPIYSINENAWWLHRLPASASTPRLRRPVRPPRGG